MAIGIGANDVANAMGTSVGSKALTIKQAIIVAMIFEFAGAYLAGGEVTDTIRKGVIDTSFYADQPLELVFGMMSALLAAGTWLLLASYMAGRSPPLIRLSVRSLALLAYRLALKLSIGIPCKASLAVG